MVSSNAKAPIAKLAQSRQAKAFLKKHKNDPVIGGGFSACLPYHSYTKILSMSRLAAVTAINEVMNELTPKDRELAQLFLAMSPRAIAKKLDLPRRLLYERLRKMRKRALKLYAKKRAGYLNQRDGNACLDAPPQLIALRTICFRLHEKEAYAYQVQRDDETLWVDAVGQAFSDEICEILDSYEDLDVNAEGSAFEAEEY